MKLSGNQSELYVALAFLALILCLCGPALYDVWGPEGFRRHHIRKTCWQNAAIVKEAADKFAAEHGGRFPEKLEGELSKYLPHQPLKNPVNHSNSWLYVCPLDSVKNTIETQVAQPGQVLYCAQKQGSRVTDYFIVPLDRALKQRDSDGCIQVVSSNVVRRAVLKPPGLIILPAKQS